MNILNDSSKVKVGESFEINIHSKYWGYVRREFIGFVFKHKISLLIVVLVLILSVLTYLGRANYIPEFSFPFGTFKIKEDMPSITESNSTSLDSKKLDRSIFDLSKNTSSGGLTSKDRVSLISDISGLETKEEIGIIEDIGTDGLTLLIRGNGVDGYTSIIRCDFSSSWKQRISLLRKNSEIKFIGTITEYDLWRGWISLNNCKLSG